MMTDRWRGGREEGKTSDRPGQDHSFSGDSWAGTHRAWGCDSNDFSKTSLSLLNPRRYLNLTLNWTVFQVTVKWKPATSDWGVHCNMPSRVCWCEGGGGGGGGSSRTSLVFQTRERVSLTAFMLQNRKRNNSAREIPLEEVVIIRSKNQGEESATLLHNLPRMVSSAGRWQQSTAALTETTKTFLGCWRLLNV